MNTSPLDTLQELIYYSWLANKPKKVGIIVEKASTTIREDLKKLTMDDIVNVRDDLACFVTDKAEYERHQRRKRGY